MRAVGLPGCGVQRMVSANDARQRYEQSSSAYRACLTENPVNVHACDGKRLIMDTDEREYNTLRASTADNIEVRSR